MLFQGSIGRTDFPRGNHQDLIDAITGKLWPLGGQTAFVTGAGSGIGQVVGDAIAQIDRQRRSVLWSDTAEMDDTGDVTGSDAAS